MDIDLYDLLQVALGGALAAAFQYLRSRRPRKVEPEDRKAGLARYQAEKDSR